MVTMGCHESFFFMQGSSFTWRRVSQGKYIAHASVAMGLTAQSGSVLCKFQLGMLYGEFVHNNELKLLSYGPHDS